MHACPAYMLSAAGGFLRRIVHHGRYVVLWTKNAEKFKFSTSKLKIKLFFATCDEQENCPEFGAAEAERCQLAWDLNIIF